MNLWTKKKNRKKLNIKFSKKTINLINSHVVKIKKGQEDNDYSGKVSQKTWDKRLP